MQGNPALPKFAHARAALVSSVAAEPRFELVVACSGFAGLEPSLADLVGVLPIRNFNRMLLDVVEADHLATVPVVAGILAVDPFLSGAALYEPLAALGVAGVLNMPSVALADGDLQRALGRADLGAEGELHALASSRDHGLEPVALVFSYAEAVRAAGFGIYRVVLHPGLPSGDRRLDRRLAEGAEVTLNRLRRQGMDALLYRHPDLETMLPGNPEDRGQLVWQVLPRRNGQPRL